ncbi:hypothetical protein GOD90_10385 [Sinorhizobium medicae]|nr:hypothetical protein [Sinorhizobium medicae]
MSTMIERVATAIDEADVGYHINLTKLVDGVSTYTLRYHGVPDTLEFDSYDGASEHVSLTRNERRARAVIEAMREPTQEMVARGSWASYGGGEIGSTGSKNAWRKMIDADLKE